jgi:hypothetical protein
LFSQNKDYQVHIRWARRANMDLIILVERKKILIFFFIGNFTILTQFCDFFLCFDFFLNERFKCRHFRLRMTNNQQLIISSITSRWSNERCYYIYRVVKIKVNCKKLPINIHSCFLHKIHIFDWINWLHYDVYNMGRHGHMVVGFITTHVHL